MELEKSNDRQCFISNLDYSFQLLRREGFTGGYLRGAGCKAELDGLVGLVFDWILRVGMHLRQSAGMYQGVCWLEILRKATRSSRFSRKK